MCNIVWSLSDNIAQGNYMCNVGPWLTGIFYEERNLYIQCWVDHAGTILHRNSG